MADMRCKDCNCIIRTKAERESGRCFLCLAKGNLEWWERVVEGKRNG